jgi:hypothetical protein
MNRRPGHIDVVTEVGYCPSCGRTRNLRREDHHLGTLVRTIVTCETCHRTLSSSIGVATAEPIKAEPEPVPEPQPESAPEPEPRKSAPAARAAAKKAAPAKKPAAVKKKPAPRGGKPTSTATRKVTKKK